MRTLPSEPYRKPLRWMFDGKCIRCLSHSARSGGYPSTKIKGIQTTWSRLVIIRRGNSPTLHALHRCDNTWCINPDHIYAGTQLQNIVDRDTRKRGRALKGEQQGSAKLTELQVAFIRQPGAKNFAALAREYRVSKPCVYHARDRKTWRHVQ